MFIFNNFQKTTVDSVGAGDICAVAGLADVMIGDTIMVWAGAGAGAALNPG